jgi:hypothetical protein
VVEHFHGKEGVWGSNPHNGSIFIMSKESNPDSQPSQKPKAILSFIGSGILVLSSIGLLRETMRGNTVAMELTMPAFMGGIGLGYYGFELLNQSPEPDTGDDDNGGGGWEPEPDMPLPSGGGLDLSPETFIPDNVCDPSVAMHVSERMPELV